MKRAIVLCAVVALAACGNKQPDMNGKPYAEFDTDGGMHCVAIYSTGYAATPALSCVRGER